MLKSRILISSKVFFLFSTLLYLGCAKKVSDKVASEKSTSSERNLQEVKVPEELQEYARTQRFDCTSGESCNPSVAKLVIVNEENVSYCTGSLVEPNIILTSASCLPKHKRFVGTNCADTVLTIFPNEGNRQSQQDIFYCDTVLSASVVSDDRDPATMESDFAFIKLKRSTGRTPLNISKSGIEYKRKARIWKSDLVDSELSQQTSSLCSVLEKSYANPFQENENVSQVTFSDCSYIDGNIGSPLLNENNEIIGVLSGKLHRSIENTLGNLLLEPISDILYASNTHCSVVPWESSTQLPKICSRKLDLSDLATERMKLLADKNIHAENFEKVLEVAEQYEKYFLFKMKFITQDQGLTYRLDIDRPLCLYNVSSWINQFKRGLFRGVRKYTFQKIRVPNYEIQTMLDKNLRPVSLVDEIDDLVLGLGFSPRNVDKRNNTYLTVKRSIFGQEENTRFSRVTKNCN